MNKEESFVYGLIRSLEQKRQSRKCTIPTGVIPKKRGKILIFDPSRLPHRRRQPVPITVVDPESA